MPSPMDGRVLLITGGTGSFGNAILKRYLETDIAEVRIFSRDEKKQNDMREHYRNAKIRYYVGDVRDPASVRAATDGVDYVFHAAALKQVPSCEFYPLEAVKTNIFGAENVIDAAVQNDVKRVIVLSTDKAVYPINAMGMTKALMEKIMIAKSRNITGGTIVCATRYGNVMASRGSVIPLFMNQIQTKNPITITDPKMTRFMMHLDEAVELVMYAFEHAEPGDVFVKKAPAATIGDLAQAMAQLFRADVNIRVIGTRHGEKLFETLVNREEMVRAEELEDYFRIPADTRDLNYNRFFSEGQEEISRHEDYTSHNTRRLTVEEIKGLLLTLDEIRAVLC
jgi:UDP-N-acetylglucosamine 4,6-dehydratase